MNEQPKSKIPGRENQPMGTLETLMQDQIQTSTRRLAGFVADISGTFGFFTGSTTDDEGNASPNADEYGVASNRDKINKYLGSVTDLIVKYHGDMVGVGPEARAADSALLREFVSDPYSVVNDPRKYERLEHITDDVKRDTGIDLLELVHKVETTGKISLDEMRSMLGQGEEGIGKYHKAKGKRRLREMLTEENKGSIAKEIAAVASIMGARDLTEEKILEQPTQAMPEFYAMAGLPYQQAHASAYIN